MPFILGKKDVELVRKIKVPRAEHWKANKWAVSSYIRQCFGEITHHLLVLVKER